MSKAKLQAAKELIQEQQYSTARAVLLTIPTDPTAQRWLAQLQTIAPVEMRYSHRSNRSWILVLMAIILGVIALYGVLEGMQRQRVSVAQAALTSDCVREIGSAANAADCAIDDYTSLFEREVMACYDQIQQSQTDGWRTCLIRLGAPPPY